VTEEQRLREMIARELNQENLPSIENLKSRLLRIAEEGGWLTEYLPSKIDHHIEAYRPTS
jgi:hypothetical protein